MKRRLLSETESICRTKIAKSQHNSTSFRINNFVVRSSADFVGCAKVRSRSQAYQRERGSTVRTSDGAARGKAVGAERRARRARAHSASKTRENALMAAP